jgi:hypothetical protein
MRGGRAHRGPRGARQPRKPQTLPQAELAKAALGALRGFDHDFTEQELATHLQADPRALRAALRGLEARRLVGSWVPETDNGYVVPPAGRRRFWYSMLSSATPDA